jgi:DNA-binding GntR family transcriptional regulator
MRNDVIRLCRQIPQTAAENVMRFDLEEGRRRHQDHHQIYQAIVCREPEEAEIVDARPRESRKNFYPLRSAKK